MADNVSMSNYFLRLFLSWMAVIPAALFGAYMAGSFVYHYDAAHTPHLSHQSFRATLNLWEAVGAIIGGAPGLLLVEWYQLRKRQKGQQEGARVRKTADDGTVWPPPPRE